MSLKEREFFKNVFSSVLKNFHDNSSLFTSSFYIFGEFVVRIVFSASSEIGELLRAFDHLKTEERENSSLILFCIDVKEEGFSLPFIPWSNLQPTEDREILFFGNDEFMLSKNPDSTTVSILDIYNGTGILLISDYSNISPYEKANPFKTILQWWFEKKGGELIHSAAVGADGAGALISGRGGIGESTISVKCLLSGMDFLGDDYVLLSKNDGYTVKSIYGTAKLNEGSLNLLPELYPAMENDSVGNEEKKVVFLNAHFPERVKKDMTLSCILIPKITENIRSEVKRSESSECFKSMAPSTLFQHIGKKERIFKFLFDLSRSVPCYKIFVGKDISNTAKIVTKVIKSHQ